MVTPLATDSERLDTILLAYDASTLEHDVSYEDFAEVVRQIRYERWLEERDLRALAQCGAVEPGPITIGEAHTCTKEPGHNGEHDW